MAQLRNTTIDDTAALLISRGTTAERPASPQTGQMRFNTSLGIMEWYDSTYTAWFPAGVVAPIATGGAVTNITQNSFNYRVHTFTSDGTFTVTRGGIVEYLIVGGGGGGADVSGGGGGGVLAGQLSIDAGSYPVLVGAATGNAPDNTGPGPSGNQSSAFGLVAVGGGGAGGGFGQAQGLTGGSGGGGGRQPSGGSGSGGWYSPGGAPIPGQGNHGGTPQPFVNGDWEGGGGGGAGTPGRDATANDWGGDGGLGIASSITGTLTFYAGGGGSGSNSINGRGGLGGGGNGAAGAAGFNATANTGGGGGGGWGGPCGAGGSGIVIVRYRTSY